MPNTRVYYGLYDGQVCSVNDPQNRGRIQCIIPEVTGDSPSAWCEPCIPVAYDDGGDFFLPKLKEFVWIMFEQGNPNKPVYLGGWWSQNRTPLGKQYQDRKSNERIISYFNSFIRMLKEENKIEIGVNEDDPEIIIEDGTVTIKGGGISGGKVDDVLVNGDSVVSNKIARITMPTGLSDLSDDSSHRLVTDSEKITWNNKADVSAIPTKVSDLQNDSDFISESEVDTKLSDKVDKVSGKGLSTNDYTTSEKNKLSGIESGAEVNVQADWNQSDNTADDYIKNKPEDIVTDSNYVHTDNNYTNSDKDIVNSLVPTEIPTVDKVPKYNSSKNLNSEDMDSTELQELFDYFDAIKEISIDLQYHGEWVDSETLVDGSILYKSNASYHVDNAWDTSKITFKGYSTFRIFIRSYAESSYDYVLVSTLNNDYLANCTGTSSMRSAYNNTTYTKAYTRSKQSSTNYEEVIFDNLDITQEYYFYVIYQKDSSANSNDDRGYFYIKE